MRSLQDSLVSYSINDSNRHLTLISAQLQKLEDGLPDSIEFERLKEHFEPLLRPLSNQAQSSGPQPHHNAIAAAASSALARDVPGLRQGPRTAGGRTFSNPKIPSKEVRGNSPDLDNAVYKPRLEAAAGVGMSMELELDWIKKLDTINGINEVSEVEQRWLSSWMPSMKAR